MSAKIPAKRVVQQTLRRLGLEAGRPGGRIASVGLRPMRLPDADLAAAARRNEPVWIDIRRVVTSFGFSYADGGWHPYWSASEAYLRNARSNVPSLATFFARYRPRTAHDALFPEGGTRVGPLERLAPNDVTVAWTMNQRLFRELARLRQTHQPVRNASQNSFGPLAPRAVESEFNRITGILESIRATGYRPLDHPDGIVEGFFLGDDDDYRFIPTEGQHRLGPLRALGIAEILVRPRFGLAGIRRRDLVRWTTARGGPYGPAEVTALFDRYFEVRRAPWLSSGRPATDAGNAGVPG